MTPLDEYLRGRYLEDGRFVQALYAAIAETTPVFYEQSTNLPLAKGAEATGVSWPYAVSAANTVDVARKLGSVSASTHCMILFALDALRSLKRDDASLLGRSFRPIRFREPVDLKALDAVVADAKETLFTIVEAARTGRPLVRSSTYGKDDPFTLTWIAEILLRLPEPEGKEAAERLTGVQEAVVIVANEALRRAAILDTSDSNGGFKEVRSCFLELRQLHLAKTIARVGRDTANRADHWINEQTPALWTRFDVEMRRQLSYAATSDSRFDPAELAFALEGALLVHPSWISPGAIDAVLQHLHLSNDRQPFWRPVTPLLGNDKGHVLFLISIEVANSILRSCELADENDPGLTRFSKIETHLRSYVGWLLDEREEVWLDATKRSIVGWRSEYEEKSNRGTVYLWYTSHVLVFLAHYHALLRKKIASDAARAAGLVVIRKHKPLGDYFDAEPLAKLSRGDRYNVLASVKKHYIRRRKASEEGDAPPMSMIVYGPPGTGKTTLAEQLAERLGQSLIVVTVSDFLAAGSADLENRAKGVFEVLRAQEEGVILFDEIDQFLLDRNTKLYKDQDDVFKFMTPGMLTKLQDLRDAESSIFIIATNYYERVDSAIRRPGRIDQHFMLSIPDKVRRSELMHRFAKGVQSNKGRKVPLSAEDFNVALGERGVLRDTALFGYGDLKNLVELRATIDALMTPDAVAEAIARVVGDVEPAVSLGAYLSRFDADSPHPYEEFLLVLHLQLESGKPLSNQDKEVVGKALRTINGFNGTDGFALLNRKGIAQDPSLFEALAQHREALVSAWGQTTSEQARN